VAPQPGTGAPRIGSDPLLTADEVAALLQVTKAWVYAETRAKRIPHVPLGRYVRYRRSAVLAWIAALERGASGGVRVRIGEE
jgi:excisionase family DNA binding protein